MLAYYLLLIVNHAPLRWRNQIRDLIFSTFSGPLSNLDVYRDWLEAKHYFCNPNNKAFVPIKLSNIQGAELANKKVAIHFHVFYTDLAHEALYYFRKFPISFDLLISCTNAEDLEFCLSLFGDCPSIRTIKGKVVENRGRDLAPLFCDFALEVQKYDYFAHIHTKKSIGVNSIGDAWRKYLFQSLLSTSHIPKILTLLTSFSIVYPKTFNQISYEDCIWGMSYNKSRELIQEMGLQMPMNGFIHFPVGSMFWAQVKAFAPLFALELSTSDFEQETGQSNGTLAHCIERILAITPAQYLGPAAIIE